MSAQARVIAPETPQEWLARVLVEHGPPPQRAHDLVASVRHGVLADRAAAQPARAAGGRS